jgi:amidophosphoribosyltransferase
MITGHGLVGFRDPNGIRPLIYGSRETELDEYIIASESVAITHLALKLSVILRQVKQFSLIKR